MASRSAAEVRAHYSNLTRDESGEYRANKYTQQLGSDPRPSLPPLPSLSASQPLDALAAQLREEGALVLTGAVPKTAVAEVRAEHARLLQAVAPQLQAMHAEGEGQPGQEGDPDDDDSFYKAERWMDDPSLCATPLRLRKTTQGRFELKSLDARDGGPFLRENFPRLPTLLEPLILPPVVHALLQALMGTPWRVMRVGSIPTQPGADAGDWHRDIGLGLFGESVDLGLPDYYFNALIPLEPLTPENGTELVMRSHLTPTERLGECPRAVAHADVGDVVFFNGKCVHRGCPNSSASWRSLIYVVFAGQFYDQGRDPAVEMALPTSVERPSGGWPKHSTGAPRL